MNNNDREAWNVTLSTSCGDTPSLERVCHDRTRKTKNKKSKDTKIIDENTEHTQTKNAETHNMQTNTESIYQSITYYTKQFIYHSCSIIVVRIY